MKPIDLGYEDKFSPCCDGDKESDDKRKVDYPCLYIYDAPKELLEALSVGQDGRAEIEFHVKSKTERSSDDEDRDDNNSMDIEIRSIRPHSKDRDRMDKDFDSRGVEGIIAVIEKQARK